MVVTLMIVFSSQAANRETECDKEGFVTCQFLLYLSLDINPVGPSCDRCLTLTVRQDINLNHC